MFTEKIWKTRKIRIYAEKRLNNNANISNLLIAWYSLMLVCSSVLNLVLNNLNLEVLLVLGSILLFGMSIFISTQKYTERALAMKNCYLGLDRLYAKVKRLENAANGKMLEQYELEYSALLMGVENHTDYDRLCFKCSVRHDKNSGMGEMQFGDWVQIFWEIAWRIILVFLLFIAPILIWFIWQGLNNYGSI